METQIKQEVVESDERCLPIICDVFSVKREEPTAENGRNVGSNDEIYLGRRTTASPEPGEACKLEIEIQELDIKREILEQETKLSIVLVRCDQVSPSAQV